MASTEEKVIELVTDLLRPADGVKPEHNLKTDLGADSLETVELFMDVEERFGVEIPDDTAEKLVTVADIIFFVDQYHRNR